MTFHNCGSNRKQKIGAFLMSVWLCAWIGMTLLHDFSHAAEFSGNHVPCAVCRLLPQSAPAAINTKLVVRAAPVFECAREVAAPSTPFRSQVFLLAAVPRGPPTLLFVWHLKTPIFGWSSGRFAPIFRIDARARALLFPSIVIAPSRFEKLRDAARSRFKNEIPS